MRPIFCGNFEFDTRQSDLERLFSKYGRVERVDMKSGFAFISMDDERDAQDAIRGLDRIEFGRQGRRLRVDWTKQERGGRRSGGSSGNSKPTKTLFVINFDPMTTRARDLEKHFDPYGKILSIRIRRNFAFVQYDLLEDATKALEATNMSKLMDEVVSVEYAVRDDDGRRNRYSPDQRGRGRSPDRSHDHGRSPSPRRRPRDSPDYGHGPTFERSRDRVRPASPHGRDRDSPDYSRGPNSNTKDDPRGNLYQRGRDSPDSSRGLSPGIKHESRGRPHRRERGSPGYVRAASPNTEPETRGSPDIERGPSPDSKYESMERIRGRERDNPDFGRGTSPHTKYEPRESTRGRERGSPDFGRAASPHKTKPEPEPRESSKYGRTKSPVHEKKYRSCSPSTRKTQLEVDKKQKRELSDI
ncbi:Serine/arginine-rich splicing factor RS40 [Thalictrum thalictroides]|uniref:Serine/arginine-rich splicing factor RS40 n=1 Tax=Thalictrum thalictroides TaxID=46969 RepID=A0A7J6V469_THATH|nr:Serine/arginine-rich splicing factor RS40 [Thalictrum thalictroides]